MESWQGLRGALPKPTGQRVKPGGEGEHGGGTGEGSGATWLQELRKPLCTPSGPQASQLRDGRAGNTGSSSDLSRIGRSLGF